MNRYATFEHRKSKGIRISIQLIDKHGRYEIQEVIYRVEDHNASSCWHLPKKVLSRKDNEADAISAWKLLKKQYGRIFRSLGG